MATPSLRHESASFWHVLAQGLIANGPLATCTVALTAAASFGLGSTPLAYLLGLVVVALWVNTPYQFSRRLASAAGLASFTAHGLGTEAGYMAGLAYGLYYLLLIPANGLFLGVLVPYLTASLGMGLPGGSWIWLSLGGLLPGAMLSLRGVRPSLTYGLVTALVQVAAVLAVSLGIIGHLGARNTVAVFTPRYAFGGDGGLGMAALVAAFGMSGSAATLSLGEEAVRPRQTIPRALIGATAILAVLYVLSAYALTVGWGVGQMNGFAAAPVPGLAVVRRDLGVGPELAVGLLAVNSLVGVNVAATLVVSRLMYAFGRAGLFPPSLAQLNGRQAPARAVVWASLLAAGAALAVGAWLGPGQGFLLCILVATMAAFLARLLGNLALPAFYRRQGAFRLGRHGILPVLSIASILAGLYTTFLPASFPALLAPVAGLAVIGAGWTQLRILRTHPELAPRSGWEAALAEEGSDRGPGGRPAPVVH